MTLYKALRIPEGITTLIGSGGKTTAIYQLARELVREEKRVAIVSTYRFQRPPRGKRGRILISPLGSEVEDAFGEYPLIFVAKQDVGGGLTGISDETLDLLKERSDYVLVEGDRADGHPIKAPAADEPDIPSDTKKVIAVMGLSALGRTLASCCYHPDIAAQILHKNETEKIGVEDLAALALSTDGLLKNVKAPLALILNQMSTGNRYEAERLASILMGAGQSEVFIAALQDRMWEKA